MSLSLRARVTGFLGLSAVQRESGAIPSVVTDRFGRGQAPAPRFHWVPVGRWLKFECSSPVLKKICPEFRASVRLHQGAWRGTVLCRDPCRCRPSAWHLSVKRRQRSNLAGTAHSPERLSLRRECARECMNCHEYD